MNLFDYLDYRAFLRDYFDLKKQEYSYWSYRYVGNKLGIDPGYFVRILQGKFHLAPSKISKVADLCKFNEKEAEFFTTLIRFNKAKTEKDSKIFFEKILSFKEVQLRQVSSSQYEYYQNWYYSAVRSVIECGAFDGDYQKLAKSLSPAITVREAKKSVKLLLELGLVEKGEQGKYFTTAAHITTGKEFQSLAVKKFQSETMDLAKESLKNHPKSKRDITTLTLTLNQEAMEDIREMARDFRRAVQKRVDEIGNANSVYQLNIQLFPLSEKLKGDN